METETEASQPTTVQIHRGRSWLQIVYLMLAIAGAVAPWLANIEFVQQYGPGFDLSHFINLANANPAAKSLSRDLAIGATAVFIWMINESKRLQIKGAIPAIASCFVIAFACGVPLFLFLRERRIDELIKKEKTPCEAQALQGINEFQAG
jgi:hypothetical protein